MQSPLLEPLNVSSSRGTIRLASSGTEAAFFRTKVALVPSPLPRPLSDPRNWSLETDTGRLACQWVGVLAGVLAGVLGAREWDVDLERGVP